MKVGTQLKGGAPEKIAINHSEALFVRSCVLGGRLRTNHNAGLTVRTSVRGGRVVRNHNEMLLG